jgi:hypothetical protein
MGSSRIGLFERRMTIGIVNVALEPLQIGAEFRSGLAPQVGVLFERLLDQLLQFWWQVGV